MQDIPLEEQKKREQDMWDFLKSLPPAEHSPFCGPHSLEKALNRLKAFLHFLMALNPMQYLNWMQKAFSHDIPTPSSMPVKSLQTQETLPAPEKAVINTSPTIPFQKKRKSKRTSHTM